VLLRTPAAHYPRVWRLVAGIRSFFPVTDSTGKTLRTEGGENPRRRLPLCDLSSHTDCRADPIRPCQRSRVWRDHRAGQSTA
jgi:hypothetical protein